MIYGENTGGKIIVAAKSLGERIELRFGTSSEPAYLHGSRGKTRRVTLEPKAAAKLIAELGKAIASALTNRPA